MSEESAIENASTKDDSLGFVETLLGTLVAPVQTFRQLSSDCRNEIKHLPGALLIVVLVFGLDAMRLTPANQIGWAVVNVPSEVTGGIMLWLLSAGVVSLTALCFGQDMHKARAAFVTLAWSLLPWIFTGSIACFWKLLGPAHVIFMTIPLCWILFLQIVAIKQSFELKTWQSLALVLLVPPMLSWYQLMQFMQSVAAVFGSLF